MMKSRMKNNVKAMWALMLCAPTSVCAMNAPGALRLPEQNFHPQLHIGIAQDKGRRSAQEDTFVAGPDVVAVFDGHGQGPGVGGLISKHAAQHVNRLFQEMRAAGCDVPEAMKRSLAILDQEALGDEFECAGSSVAMAALHQGYLYACHMGDSPFAIFDKTNAGYRLRCRTESHTPARRDQAEQVFKAGCTVKYGLKSEHVTDIWQMAAASSSDQLPPDFSSETYNIYASYMPGAGVMMTRALGDKTEKEIGMVTAEPEFLGPQKLNPDSLVVLASDALTDAFNFEQFTQQVNEVMALSDAELENQPCALSAHCGLALGNNERLKWRARRLAERILGAKKSDNMTLVLAQLAEREEEK